MDTSALLALHYSEPGADRVAQLLTQGLEPTTGAVHDVIVLGCFMSLMEVLYRVWKN